MPNDPYIPFFDLTPSQQEDLLNKVLEKEIQRTLDIGLYVTYRDKHCISDDEFIHEYKDGRKQLVRINMVTGKDELIKELK